MNDDIIELSAKVLARSYVAGVQIRKNVLVLHREEKGGATSALMWTGHFGSPHGG